MSSATKSTTQKNIVSKIDKTTADINAKKDELSGKFDAKYGDYIDFINNQISIEFGDDYANLKHSVENAFDSAKNQLKESIDELLAPDPNYYR